MADEATKYTAQTKADIAAGLGNMAGFSGSAVVSFLDSAATTALTIGSTDALTLGTKITNTVLGGTTELVNKVTGLTIPSSITAGTGTRSEVAKNGQGYPVSPTASDTSAASLKTTEEINAQRSASGDAIANGYKTLGPVGTSSIYEGRDATGVANIDTTAKVQWSTGTGKTSYNREQAVIDNVWDHQKGNKARIELTNTRSSSGQNEVEIEYEFILLGLSMSQSEDVQLFKAFNMHVINSFGSGVPVLNMNMLLAHNKYKPWFGNMMDFYHNRAKSSVSVPKGYSCKLYLDNAWFEILPFGYSMDRDSSNKYGVGVTMQAFVLNQFIYNDVQKVIVSFPKDNKQNMTNTLYKSVPAQYNTSKTSVASTFKSALTASVFKGLLGSGKGWGA